MDTPVTVPAPACSKIRLGSLARNNPPRHRFTVMQPATEIHLVRVTTDDGEVQIWLAATSREEAVDRVLEEIPEGWAVSLIQRQLATEHIPALNMAAGEVRRHLVS
ncbi:hypothetical protein [Bradyrhizobium australafricanum]|uniref:hypothetical protein n=1 Tax=Bradyrhizobium australafricanum TaxID=2821406 RepID=UPI001CE34205|nr:hypothetical protein [Bradyrhizobium australafricanum]MCA6105510.1 hypothetical protein [Bradyrhizobium australafricanum]